MFYTFIQNKSGGYLVCDEKAGVNEVVIIEADSNEEAYDILCKIGEKVDGFHDFCECCGERWIIWDDNGYAHPSIYGEPLGDYGQSTAFRKSTFTHYKSGKIQKVKLG